MEWVTNKVPDRVVDALGRGVTILTGSQRLAREVAGGSARSAATRAGQRQPRILTWRAWTSGLWHRALLTGATDRMLLNRTQEQAIWRDLIRREPAVASLRSPGALARLASEAWRGLAQYRGLGRLAGSGTNADTEAFVRLAAAFDERCGRDGYLSEARLEGALRQAIRAGSLTAEDTSILLYGFDRLVPAQKALLDALQAGGVAVEVWRPETPAPKGYLHTADDEAAEIRSAAVWARGFLREHPGARIGILAPALAADGVVAAQAGRVLREVLAPEAAAIGNGDASLRYEIASSKPLAAAPAVADALDLLSWTAGPLPLDRLGCLLLSTNVGGMEEQAARAEFDAFELRRAQLLRPEMTLDRLVTRLSRSSRKERLTQLLGTLRGMQAAVRRDFGPSERRLWGGWSEAVRELLAAAGWASLPPADAAEFETRRAWDSALDELATLDFDGGRVSFAEALGTLRSIAEDSRHTVPFRGAPVQVMTPGEAEGLRFDGVWFLGAGDLGWPAPVAGSPLLAWPLRRELGMPGGDHVDDFAQARRLTEEIAASATTVIFSYARETANGRQRLSPVLRGARLELVAVTAEDHAAPRVELEAVPDTSRLQPPPEGPVPGGAAVLQTQAACAFRAFSEHRLFAAALESRDPGMNARERGSAVHRVLERFWETVQRQDALRTMTTEEVDERLRESITWAIARAQSDVEGAWDGAYLETQRQRLMNLGRQWLVHEAERGVPFTVAQREAKTQDATIGPLHLTLRVDRIDVTEHGAVLIDYKTGNAKTSHWTGERPDEPQLPLYAVLLEGAHLHAIAFGKIRPGTTMGFEGFEDGDRGTLKKPARPDAGSLDEQLVQWRNDLIRLATQFWNGNAQVAPKEYPKTCAYCAQRVLCRLDVASMAEEEEEEEEDWDESSSVEAGRFG